MSPLKTDKNNDETLSRIESIIIAENDKLEQRKKIKAENDKKIKELILYEQNIGKYVRSFEIDGFGFWNCDRPINNPLKNIIATYIDTTHQEVKLDYICSCVPNIMMINRSYLNNLSVVVNKYNFILGVSNNHLFYTKMYFRDTLDNTKMDIVLNQIDEKNKNYTYIKSLCLK
jgi:hypothetical protein